MTGECAGIGRGLKHDDQDFMLLNKKAESCLVTLGFLVPFWQLQLNCFCGIMIMQHIYFKIKKGF